MRRSTWIATVACALWSTACATSSPPPTRQLADSRAAVRVAEEVGATEDPQAAQYLGLARKQLAQADQEMQQRNYDRAEHWLRQAQANAELSAALAREAKARNEVTALRQQIEELDSRMPPRSPREVRP
jgi:chromosome segregation ATPase